MPSSHDRHVDSQEGTGDFCVSGAFVGGVVPMWYWGVDGVLISSSLLFVCFSACHWGVINALTNVSPNNCDIVATDLDVDTGDFQVLQTFEPPGDVARSI